MKINEENYLIELCKKNEKALEYIIDKYSAIVNGVVRKVLLPLENNGLIEECISDIFFSVWNNIGKFSGENEKFKNWIAGISKYKAIDYYRKYSNEKYKTSDIDKHNLQDSQSIEEDIIIGIETRKVLDLINFLKEPDKSIFVMKFLFGYSSRKISEKLGIGEGTINTKVSRARKRLRAKYTTLEEVENYE